MEYNKHTMTSQVFYRKWRPQTLSEVVGQEHVTQTLRHAIDSGRVAHAYLFCGPRGTGKTSTGRILAKAVNCLNPTQGEPCNDCDVCRAINEGNALDVIEIDAASNRGIDEIRDLREKVNYSPNLAHYKVYIIDEVHMITKEASNAFLKTLEEPPPYAIFVLATTEPHKVLPTILSRCQRFDFHRLSQSAVISKLNLVCDKEDVHIEPEALRLIAKVTTGSLRDAENLLEQLVAYYGHEIELNQVQAMLGISGDLRVRELAKHIIDKDISAGLETINSVSSDGLDLRQFNRELVDYLRDLLLVKSGSESVVDVTSDDLNEIRSLAAGAPLDYLVTAVKLFGGVDLRWDNYSPLPLELALVECILSVTEEKQLAGPAPSKSDKSTEVAHPHAKSSEPRQEPKPPAPAGVASLATKSIKAVSPEPEKTVDVASPATKSAKSPPEPQTPTAAETAETPDTISPGDIDYLRSRWKEFVDAMRGEGSRGNLDAVLRSASEPLSVEDGTLTVGFYHEFHKSYIEDPKYKHLVEKKLREVFGQPYKLSCVIIERSKEAKTRPEAESPLVKAALEMGAKIIDDKAETEEK